MLVNLHSLTTEDDMKLWYFVFVSTLVNLYKDSAGTVCSDAVTDGTAVLNMCEGGNAVGDHVVIDTYGSSAYRKDGGSTSINCSCTATVTGLSDGTMTTVGLGSVQSLYPPSGCGSTVIISASRETTTASQSRTTTAQSGETTTPSRETITQSREITTQSRMTVTQSGETTTPSREIITQSRETTTQSRMTTTQSRETTTQSRMTTTQSRETTTYNSTNSGSTTLGQKCVQQNDLQQCYPLSAVVVPLVVTSLLVTVTVVVHFILYRKRLAIVKQPEYTEAVMTSPNPVHYDSLDLSRVEPPNLYADTSTGQMNVNTAMES